MKRFRTPLFLFALASAATLTACGGGGGGGSTPSVLGGGGGGQTGSTPTPAPVQQTASTTSGIVYLPNWLDSTHAMQVVHYEDTTGAVLTTPTVQTLSTSDGSTLGQVVASSDYSVAAVMIEGASSLDMTKVAQASLSGGTFATAGSALDLSTIAQGPLHSIAMFPDGGVMLVQGGDGQNYYAIGGISSGTPSVLGAIAFRSNPSVWNPRNVAVGSDGKSVIIRGSGNTEFYSVTTTPNSNGTTTYNFNETASIASVASSGTLDGTGAMAYTKDGSAALFGDLATGTQIALVSGIPAAPVEGTPISLSPAGTIHSIAVSPSGTMAVVGSGSGLFVIGGVSTGSLVQVGSNYSGTFTASDGSTQQVANVTAAGFSSDGKFVAAIVNYTLSTGVAHDSLVVVPIDASGNLGKLTACVNDVNPGSTLQSDLALFR